MTAGERIARLAWAGVAAALVLGVVGLWFSSDPGGAVLGKYSVPTLLGLVLATVLAYLAVALLRFLLVPSAAGGRVKRAAGISAALAVLVGLLATEAALQWRAASASRAHSIDKTWNQDAFDPFLQAVPKPGDPELGINRWGFRGEDIAQPKPAGRFRIFVLGGSTALSSRVGFEQSHARVLENQLRRRYPERAIEVQNAGMHWHTTQHSLMKLLFRVQDFDPDLVVVFHAINDLFRSCSPKRFAAGPYRSDYSHYWGPVTPLVRAYFAEPEPLRLLAPKAAGDFVSGRWFADFRGAPEAQGGKDLRAEPVREWPSLTAFERNLENLVRVARARDLPLVLASQPFLYRRDLSPEETGKLHLARKLCRSGRGYPDVESMILGMEAFNAASRRIAEAHGVPYVDLEAAVPKTGQYFLDDVHYTPEGNRVVGIRFAEEIAAAGLVSAR